MGESRQSSLRQGGAVFDQLANFINERVALKRPGRLKFSGDKR